MNMPNLPKWVTSGVRKDSTTRVSLNLLQKDIDRAVPQSPTECAGANCTKRAFGAKHVHFFRTTIYIDFGHGIVERFIPSRQFFKRVIEPLDSGDIKNVIPGRYDLLPPPPSYRLGKAGENRTKRGNAKPKKKNKYKARRVVGRLHTV